MKNLIIPKTAIAIILSFFFIRLEAQQQDDKTLSPYLYVQSKNDSDQIPLKSSSVNVNIAGVIADVQITQVYENTGKNKLEAIYVFPSSTRAAVYGMEMIIGDRKIEAEIKERKQAQQLYEAAKAEGKRTSLLEQERTNVFQMHVANIMPGDSIEVKLYYTELLIPVEGIYEFVHPTVSGPRYTPHNANASSNRNQYAHNPYLKPGEKPSYSFDLKIHLNAGMPIKHLESNTHKMTTTFNGLSEVKLHLDNSEKFGGNRDFILNYQLAGKKIQSGLMLYKGEHENFFNLIIQPPKQINDDYIPPREYIFIVDVSGSMKGFPINTTKTLIRNLVSDLKPTDKFNVMLFASSSRMLSEESLYATPENIRDALELIEFQKGGGGTKMYPAMQKALALPRCELDASRSMILITDGYVQIERKLFDLIENNMDESNVFAFGIGKSVNRYLIEGVAHAGKGEAFIVTNPSDANIKAEKLKQYVSNPVLTQIKVDYGAFEVYDVSPTTIPDVLAERPIIIYGKWKGEPKGNIKMSAYSGNGPYYSDFNVTHTLADDKNTALKYLWARETIRLLSDYKDIFNDKNTIDSITSLGLKYNLLTDFTSFLAVDENITKAGHKETTIRQALPLPEGVTNSAVGFEMSISGVVRSSLSPNKINVSVLNSKKPLSTNQQKEMLTWIKEKFKNPKGLSGKKIIFTVKIDQVGAVTSINFDSILLNEHKMFIEQLLLNKTFNQISGNLITLKIE